MEIPKEIVDADFKDEDSEDLSLHESIVVGTVQISDTVQIDQEVYNEKKVERADEEPTVFEEIKESVIETTSKLADAIAKLLDEPEDQVVGAIENESKAEEIVSIDADVEIEHVIAGVKFAHDLSENRRGSTFLTEVDDMDENDKIVEEKVEQIVEKVVAEHSSGPSLAEEVSKEDDTVVEKLLEEVQNAPTTEADQTEEISSQTEAIQEISTTETVEEASSTSQTEAVEEAIEEISSSPQTEAFEETSSTSQTEVIEEASYKSQTEVIEETSQNKSVEETSQTEVIEEASSISQSEVIEETSSTSQTDPVERTEVFAKTCQTTCSDMTQKEAYEEQIEIIEEPIIEIV